MGDIQKKAEKLKLPQIERHILMCDDKNKCCSGKKSKESLGHFKDCLSKAGLLKSGQVRVSGSSCFGLHRAGANP